MKTKGITKVAMAEQMHTSRAQLDLPLTPDNSSMTRHSFQAHKAGYFSAA